MGESPAMPEQAQAAPALPRGRGGGRPRRRRGGRRHRGEREHVGDAARSRLPHPGDGVATLYRASTATPIKHLVVIFDENESFDHYFGTYPYAANTTAPRSSPSRAPRP